MLGKGPFSGSSKLFRCSNGLEKTRPVSFLEHTAGVLITARKNELLCANVGRDILMLWRAVLRDWGGQKGGRWKRRKDSIREGGRGGTRGEGSNNFSALLKAECIPASLGFLDSSHMGFSSSAITVGCSGVWFSVMELLYGLRKRRFQSGEDPAKSGNWKKNSV